MHDLICVGFGPAALSVAIALHDSVAKNSTSSLRVLFIEKQEQYTWHGGMLLPSARMQISFVKDFATLRDPTSHFTFLNYLHTQGRLVDFVNTSTFYPFREEYQHYMHWCASHFNDRVAYSEQVTGVRAIETSGSIKAFSVESCLSSDPSTTIVRNARNVLICTGGQPRFPPGFPLSGSSNIIHSSSFMYNISKIEHAVSSSKSRMNIAVIGAGQSAAEIASHLHDKFGTQIDIDQYFSSTALRPSDDSPFVNEIFNPDAVDEFYSLSADRRRDVLLENRATNYSVVRMELIEKIYQDIYAQKLPGHLKTFRLMPSKRVLSAVEQSDSSVLLTVASLDRDDQITTNQYDLVIAATGYDKFQNSSAVLGGIQKYFIDEKLSVDRFYKVALDKRVDAGLWILGSSEHTHGISDSLLSIMAVRAGEVVDRIFFEAANKKI
ncbi:L-lysine 6-monooxygenase [Kockiozyma suomiensis]|uniref:L-lysine 6-monooxygenase n=1 Tax=Kockiozyma suomiensis TaxID=1337062 RepID=UPI003343768B